MYIAETFLSDAVPAAAAAAVSAAADLTLSGVAATGGPMAGATITVTPTSGPAKTVTAGADGSFSITTTADMTPPYVISAEGQVGDSVERLFSVAVTVSPTQGTVNVTPLTNAIAASLASTGIPSDLLNAGERSNITSTKVNQAQDAYKTVLADVFTAAGLSAADQTVFNLLSSTFKADGTGFDKVLDALKVEVKPTGEIVMTSVGSSLVDDTGTNPATPTASTALILAKGSLPVAGDKAKLPAPAAGTAILTIGDLQPLRQALIACFKLAASARGTFASPGSACSTFATRTYKHQGRSGAQEFNALLADTTMDNAEFAPPQIIRQVTATKALVKYGTKRGNGFIGSIVTVVEKQANGDWLMAGNQRNFEVFVNAYVSKRDSLLTSTTTPLSRKDTGINIIVRNNSTTFAQDANITAVKVFGPGLPGWVDTNNVGTGLTLNKISGCDFWSLSSTICSSLLRMQVFDITTGAKVEFASLGGLQPFALNPRLTDANVTSIQPDSPYRFDLTVTGTGTVTFWERLRSRPYNSDEIAMVTFLEFSDATKAMVNTSSASVFSGGGKPTLNWANPASTAPAFSAWIFHAQNSDSQSVKPSDRSATISCSGNTNCDSAGNGNFKAGMNFLPTGAANETRRLQRIARNRYDTQIFTQVSRP